MEKFRPWQDLNLQSPVSETDALSIRPQGRCCERMQKVVPEKHLEIHQLCTVEAVDQVYSLIH